MRQELHLENENADRLGCSREDRAHTLVGDRGDPLVGVFPLGEEQQCFPRPTADPDGPSAVFPVESRR
jgi:hypothetical protein